jgi:hypothetical protein
MLPSFIILHPFIHLKGLTRPQKPVIICEYNKYGLNLLRSELPAVLKDRFCLPEQ